MSLIFVDTSALLKRYIIEPGSQWVRSWIAPTAGNQIIIAEIGITETLATLARFRRERRLSSARFDRLREDFLAHTDSGLSCESAQYTASSCGECASPPPSPAYVGCPPSCFSPGYCPNLQDDADFRER